MKRNRTTAEEYAWVGPVVQGVCGAFVGGLVGIGIWGQFLGGDRGWVVIPATAVVFAVLAAAMGDRFWEEGYWNWW